MSFTGPRAEPDRDPAAAAETAAWCAGAARLVHLSRRHGLDGLDARALRARLVADLVALVQDHAPLELEVTPRSIVLDGESPVFVADNSNAPTGEPGLERELSWVLHRDGVRALGFERGLDEREAAALLDALVRAAPASATHEDLVTLLWEAELGHVRVLCEEASLARPGSRAPEAPDDGAAHADDRPSLAIVPLPEPASLWPGLRGSASAALDPFRRAWASERDRSFADQAEEFALGMLDADPRPAMAQAIAVSLVTWLATCLQRSQWEEAARAHALLKRVDPTGRWSEEPLTHAFGSVDGAAITERLDEADPREQARLFALAVRVGAPALPLLVSVLGQSGRVRVRAGATTALAYAFADDPAPLGLWLGDPRWHVVRNLVYVLGQIGGTEVVPHLASAARHVDARVRRAAVLALGQVPPGFRTAVLLGMLDTGDDRLLAAVLGMLSRDPDARVRDALLARVRAPEFDARAAEQKQALVAALADVAGDQALPALEELLARGGWFARRSPERSAAAAALARLASPAARAVLERGLRHRSDAVREACAEALRTWDAA